MSSLLLTPREKHSREVLEFLKGFQGNALVFKEGLLPLYRHLLSLSGLVGCLCVSLNFFRIFLVFVHVELLPIFGGNLDSSQPLVHLIEGRQIEQNPIFRDPGPAFVELVWILLGEANTDHISVVKIPVVVVDVLPIGHHKATGAEGHSHGPNIFFSQLHLLQGLGLHETDLDFPVQFQHLDFEVAFSLLLVVDVQSSRGVVSKVYLDDRSLMARNIFPLGFAHQYFESQPTQVAFLHEGKLGEVGKLFGILVILLPSTQSAIKDEDDEQDGEDDAQPDAEQDEDLLVHSQYSAVVGLGLVLLLQVKVSLAYAQQMPFHRYLNIITRRLHLQLLLLLGKRPSWIEIWVFIRGSISGLLPLQRPAPVDVTIFLFPPRAVLPTHHLPLPQQVHPHLFYKLYHHQLGPELGSTPHDASQTLRTFPELQAAFSYAQSMRQRLIKYGNRVQGRGSFGKLLDVLDFIRFQLVEEDDLSEVAYQEGLEIDTQLHGVVLRTLKRPQVCDNLADLHLKGGILFGLGKQFLGTFFGFFSGGLLIFVEFEGIVVQFWFCLMVEGGRVGLVMKQVVVLVSVEIFFVFREDSDPIQIFVQAVILHFNISQFIINTPLTEYHFLQSPSSTTAQIPTKFPPDFHPPLLNESTPFTDQWGSIFQFKNLQYGSSNRLLDFPRIF